MEILGLQPGDSIVVCNEDSIVKEAKLLRYAKKEKGRRLRQEALGQNKVGRRPTAGSSQTPRPRNRR